MKKTIKDLEELYTDAIEQGWDYSKLSDAGINEGIIKYLSSKHKFIGHHLYTLIVTKELEWDTPVDVIITNYGREEPGMYSEALNNRLKLIKKLL